VNDTIVMSFILHETQQAEEPLTSPSRSLTLVESPCSDVYSQYSQKRQSCLGKKMWSLGLLLLLSGVSVICLVGVFLSQGGESSVPDIISGVYQLEYYDEEYSQFLTAMGVPRSVQTLLLSVREQLIVTMIGETRVKIETVTDYLSTETQFQLNTQFTRQYGNSKLGGTLANNCSKPSLDSILCRSEEESQGWSFLSLMTFYPAGLVNSRTFVTSKITTVKYYQRVGSKESIEDIIHNCTSISNLKRPKEKEK